VGPALVVVGVLAIVGEVCTLKRKVWPFVLAGAIAGFFSTSWWVEYWVNIVGYGFSLDTLRGLTGIPAIVVIVLTVLARKQIQSLISGIPRAVDNYAKTDLARKYNKFNVTQIHIFAYIAILVEIRRGWASRCWEDPIPYDSNA